MFPPPGFVGPPDHSGPHDPFALSSCPVARDWALSARDDQRPPSGGWRTWLLLGGRGAGKTRTGAEWVLDRVRAGARRVALVAPTLHDARAVMVEGESGLLHLGAPWERPTFRASLRRLDYPNGASAHVFTSEDPDSLRGPQFDAAWADEFCAWSHAGDTLANLRMGLRLGADPRLVVTTTPRPTPPLKALMAEPGTVLTRGTTEENAALSPDFADHMQALYGGTHLGRQELMGELVEDVPGALWPRDLLLAVRRRTAPPLARIVVAVDPPVSTGARADACGIVVAGLADDGTVWVVEDATRQGLSPSGWAARVAARYAHWKADCVVAEVNQGGDLVRDVLLGADPGLPVRMVHASRGKRARAEPVALLYERGRVRHLPGLEPLEDELNRIGTPGQTGSPDRADALVWAVRSLVGTGAEPSVRRL